MNIKNICDDKNIEVVSRIPKNTIVCADYDSTTIILRNLIDNSIKYSKPNSSIFIHQINSNKPNTRIISIKDEGVGMDPSTLRKLLSNSFF